MKARQIAGVVAVFMFVFLSFSCATKSYNNLNLKRKMHSTERYGELKGLVQADKQGVFIIANPQSRSRVDYEVEGNLKEKIKNLKGKIITVEGDIERDGWSGSINVKKILSNGK